ncbi:MAG: hypothetical protein COT88_00525 [Candidatus Colwellbacteria bacterium CG10_big_fil_rev_8_21_14_0_10_41_28]|uniref:Glycosyltransferase RgtA/B/C/D-like domain-containing protein n=1 Tax=Candidatus Colwellbacteria bacterium CG10_big_fil_rev_8_21_14_0_10_41_28 TaxID=1974539 RepID=A0A2H0VHP9_9BACT|nr:MAG: hypothetical protein COT88_00525 [Candidatus Colwellbacteria bacterium CG10_big_fil_rev_8_21_14_0_10_41_28]
MKAQIPKVILGLILISSSLLMIGSSFNEAATMDELAHIPSGYGYAKYLDYRLNPEHPPIIKLLAATPLLFMDLDFPTESTYWQNETNAQWDMGRLFLYESGNDADAIIFWSRLFPILLALGLTFLIYLWSKEIMGQWWALLPTAATAFTPNILAHGHYVTTDVGAAFGIILSLYFFTRYIVSPTKKNLIYAGITFGIAQLMKFSSAILVGHFIFLILIYLFIDILKNKGRSLSSISKKFFSGFGELILIFMIGAIVIYPAYLLTTAGYPPEKQLADTSYILGDLEDGPCGPVDCLARLTLWGADKPLIRPLSQYALGLLMVIQRSSGGNTSYFMGQVYNLGNPTYFPTVYILKEPIPLLIMIIYALYYGIYSGIKGIKKRKTRFLDYLKTNTYEVSALLFILIYVAYSVSSPLNIGVRHLIPIIPLIYILTFRGIKTCTQESFYNKNIKIALISFLMIWFVAGSLLIYPNYLPYYNEIVGIDNGWQYATDSNYDWGQDMKKLEPFLEREGIDKIALDFFGASSPEYYIGDKFVSWHSAKGNPKLENIDWLAVSINHIQNSVNPTAPGYTRPPQDSYSWLENPHSPYAIVGKTIFIYKL